MSECLTQGQRSRSRSPRSRSPGNKDNASYTFKLEYKLLNYFVAVKTTTEPVPKSVSTTAAPLEACALPDTPPGLSYQLQGSNETTALIGSTITYACDDGDSELADGDVVHTCVKGGQFQGRQPLCIDGKAITLKYLLYVSVYVCMQVCG